MLVFSAQPSIVFKVAKVGSALISMNETLVLIATITKIWMNIAITCAIGIVIYNRKRILEALEKIRQRDVQRSHDEQGVAFVDRRDGDFNEELQ